MLWFIGLAIAGIGVATLFSAVIVSAPFFMRLVTNADDGKEVGVKAFIERRDIGNRLPAIGAPPASAR